MKLLQRRTLHVAILSILLASLCAYVYVYVYMPRHAEASIAYWESRISLVGPDRAYSELKDFVRNDKASDQHEDAHRFGAALYKVEGLSGIRHCDDEFWFGCFHYFLAAAIVDHGLSIIPEIVASCTDQDGPSYPCFHGVGHGVMIVSGFDLQGVETALSHCRDIADDTQYHCMYGAFMEFNSQNFLLDLTSSSTTERPQENPYGVCDSLGDPSIPERMWCIASLPQWWSTRGDVDKQQQGTWCAGLQSEGEQEACFQAIGKTTLFVKEPSPEKTHALCERASTDHRAYVVCVSGAYKLSLNHRDMLREPPERICNMFEDASDRVLCTSQIQPESGWWATFYD